MLAQNTRGTPDDDELFDAEDSPKEYIELGEKVKIEFCKCIQDDTIIHHVLIYQSHRNNNISLHAGIILKDKSKDIEISKLLNNKFCENNKITDFSILGDNGKIISGYVANNEDGKKN